MSALRTRDQFHCPKQGSQYLLVPLRHLVSSWVNHETSGSVVGDRPLTLPNELAGNSMTVSPPNTIEVSHFVSLAAAKIRGPCDGETKGD